MKLSISTYFHTRTDVANYLRISRMSLHRYEKIHPLTARFKGSHLFGINKDMIDRWKKELREKAQEKRIYIELET